MIYVCPKCKQPIESSVELEYCVCGGKYNDPVQTLKDVFGIDIEGKE